MQNIWMFLQQTSAASLTALFILLLQRIFRDKLSPKWQYTIWLVLLARLVVPAGWGAGASLDVSGWLDAARVAAELKLSSAWAGPWTACLPLAGLPLPPSEGAPRSVSDWLFAAYLAGVLVCAFWLLLGWHRLNRTVKNAVPVAGERLEQVNALALRFGLAPPARMVESMAVHGPFLMGVLRPTLVVPMDWQVDGKVVLHELLHRSNQDVAAGWATALFRCIHWCNPFLWRVFDRIDNQREQRCDQQVLERLEGEDRRDYGRVLLSMAEDRATRAPGATTMANGARHIKARVQAIARFKTFPQGMGLVSVCMTLILLPNLVVGFSAAAAESPARRAPSWVSWFGDVGQMTYAMSNRATTVAGALDAYGKAMYHQWYSPTRYYGYQAMVTPKEDLPALWQEWEQGTPGEEVQVSLLSDSFYRTGPVFRGLAPDGEGGYWTQMYFFRDEPLDTAQRLQEWQIGYRRHTLSIRPQADGTWTVTPLSVSTGQLDTAPFCDDSLRRHDLMSIPFPEPPVFFWVGEVDGVSIELWPESNLSVQDAYLNCSDELRLLLDLSGFFQNVRTDAPDLDALFSSVEGSMAGRLTNLTDQPKRFTLGALQRWSAASGANSSGVSGDLFLDFSFGSYSGGSYSGYDLQEYEVELAPRQSIPLYYGGRGKGRGNGISVDQCVSADQLTVYYTDEQGNFQPVSMRREVNLE